MKRISDNTRFLRSGLMTEDFLKKFENKTLKQLQHDGLFVFPQSVTESDDLEETQMIFISEDINLRTTNVMGFLQNKDEQLMIHSRFDQHKDYFLYYMLQRVFNMNFTEAFFSQDRNTKMFDLLKMMFPKLLNAAMKKGLYKEYKSFKHNDSNVSGVIDIDRHIKLNRPFVGKVAYNTRNYSFENNVMLLIRYTVEHLKRHQNYRLILNNQKVTMDYIKKIETVTPNYKKYDVNQIIFKNMIRPVRHGYYQEYRTLQCLCIAILKHEYTHYAQQNNEDLNGILFDGAWLFEEYINTVIGDYFHHPMNKAKVGRQYLFNGNRGHIYPDFISNHKLKETIVCDAKYKRNKGIGNHDYLQVLAYMYRFNSRRGIYIYPYAQTMETKKKYTEIYELLDGYGHEAGTRKEKIEVVKLGMEIPFGVVNYSEFIEEIEKNESRLLKYILVNNLDENTNRIIN